MFRQDEGRAPCLYVELDFKEVKLLIYSSLLIVRRTLKFLSRYFLIIESVEETYSKFISIIATKAFVSAKPITSPNKFLAGH